MGKPHDDAGAMSAIVLRYVKPGADAEAEALMRRIAEAARTFEGYLGADIFPPIPGVQDSFVVIYRHETSATLRAWFESETRLTLVARLEKLLVKPALEFHFCSRRREPGTVSTVLAYRVKPDANEQYQEWRRRITAESAKQPGFRGTESFDSVEAGDPHHIIVVRFDSRQHLDDWLASDARAPLMEEVHAYIDDYQVRRIGTGFEGWFDYGPGTEKPPASWRQWLVILGALFPVIMGLKAILEPIFEFLPFPLAFLILLSVDVAMLTWLIMPHFSRLMNFFLRPRSTATWKTNVGGLAILAALIGTTLAIALTLGN